jgi:hypothetical protein
MIDDHGTMTPCLKMPIALDMFSKNEGEEMVLATVKGCRVFAAETMKHLPF